MNFRLSSKAMISLMLLWGLVGCYSDEEPDYVFDYDLRDDLQGWAGGFADFPVDTTGWPDFELVWGQRNLPSNLGTGGGLYISGKNYSDDLFMFNKRLVWDLKPYTAYKVRFQIDVATNAPSQCGGIGGPPGESVYLKAGATIMEPDTIAEEGYYHMNIDKGNQAAGGKDAIVLGHIGNSNTDCLDPVYEIKSFDSKSQSFQVTTSEGGNLWILVGTDSGFEGRTSLYYTKVCVTLTREP
ncbi:MAG: hypothetical protein ACETWG_03425 [Candidatus Neomarinimicrobiota bacterium]